MTPQPTNSGPSNQPILKQTKNTKTQQQEKRCDHEVGYMVDENIKKNKKNNNKKTRAFLLFRE